jgi:hypothetical protein
MDAAILWILLQATDSIAVDTTGSQYKVGYYIGSYLPFIILVFIFILYIRSTYNFKNKK